MQARGRGRAGRRFSGILLAMMAVTALVGCGSSNKAAAPTTTTGTTMDMNHKAPPATGDNACPVEGCVVKITNVVRDGKELKVTWHTNYTPQGVREPHPHLLGHVDR